jgi:hypothetical protein
VILVDPPHLTALATSWSTRRYRRTP